MVTKTIRVVSREVDGSIRTKDHETTDAIKLTYDQIGIDDCSTDLTLRGFPVFRGLVGPIVEGKHIARYETPEVFESLTKDWSQQKTRRRRAAESAPIPAMHFPLVAMPTPQAASGLVS
jgi:hypothetical protein